MVAPPIPRLQGGHEAHGRCLSQRGGRVHRLHVRGQDSVFLEQQQHEDVVVAIEQPRRKLAELGAAIWRWVWIVCVCVAIIAS